VPAAASAKPAAKAGPARAADRRAGGGTPAAAKAPASSATPLYAQRKCANCGSAPRVLRKPDCGCGGTCAACKDDQALRRVDGSRADGARGAAPAPPRRSPLGGLGAGRPLDRGERDFFEPRFGRSFDAVRVHDGPQADRAARDYDAQAYTVGQDIVFGRGQYRPGTQPGRELLAHELAHTVQQRDGRVATQRQAAVSMPGDPLEREADAMAGAVLRSAAPQEPRATGSAAVQRFELPSLPSLEEVESAGEALIDDPLGTLGGAAGEVAEELGIPTDVLDTATRIAAAIGGSVSVSGWTITIAASAIDFPWALTLEPDLGDIFNLQASVPLFEWPIGPDVFLQGEVGVEIGVRPILGVQVGPGTLNSLTLVIDAAAPSARLDADLEFTLAGQLGAELHADAFGEVGLLFIVPPGIPISVPVASIEAGLAGQIVGTAIATTHATGSARADLYGLGVRASTHTDLGLAVGYGVGGFGSLSLLGVNLCTLYWPIWSERKDTVLAFDVDAALSVDASGIAGSFDITEPVPSGLAFDDLPLALPANVLSDDCPLCEAAQLLGVLPLDNLGGGWANWTPKALPGPLQNTYVRNPGFASGSECRGACGPDCFSCDELGDAIVCEDLGPAGTQLWLYERLAVCPTHDGCRQHDGGYDWCAGFGESTIFGPCHRLPDFEAVCSYGASNAVGWIIGMPPHDADPFFFADSAVPVGVIDAPCPEDAIDPANPPRPSLGHRYCFDDITLIDEHALVEAWGGATTNEPILDEPIVVPVYGPIVLVVIPYVRGEWFALVSGTLGPVELVDICAVLDVGSPSLSGEATLRTNMALAGAVGVAGVLGTDVNLDCLVPIANVEGGVSLSGSAALSNVIDERVAVTIDADGVSFDAALSFDPCLNLAVDLAAFLRVSLAGYPVWGESWSLAAWEWERCWPLHYAAGEATRGAAAAALGAAPATGVGAGGAAAAGVGAGASDALPAAEAAGGTSFPIAALLRAAFAGAGGGATASAGSGARPVAASAGAPTAAASAALPAAGAPDLPDDVLDAIQEACITEPEEHAPDGWTPDDPIEMRWFKDAAVPGLYPSPIELEQPGGRTKRYYPRRPDMVMPEAEMIGVPDWPGRGALLTYAPGYSRDRTQAREFRELLAAHGFQWGGRRHLQADHVHDLAWGGRDQFANIWPADGAFNGYAGLCQNIVQEVTYESWPSGEVVTTPIYMARNEANSRGRDRYFVIGAVRFGGCR
jgi:hypothetical protein